jgi:DNA-binding Lrp family transcriptional regulator
VDTIDQNIINTLQQGFPVSERPYQQVAGQLGISESDLLQRLQDLLNARLLTRFGPMYHAERLGGGLTLAAMAIAEQDFQDVCDAVNQYPEVAHNYRREHRLNMWFVLATETPQRISEVIADIENKTGYTVYNMPKEEEFFVGLKFEV